MARPSILVLILVVPAALGLGILTNAAPSRDLLALWMAAKSVALGQPEAVYPAFDGLFRMLPPESWHDLALRIGEPGVLYPYLYPPLWAWLLAPLTDVLEFRSFAKALFLFNTACLVALPFLAKRIAFPPTGAPAPRYWWFLAILMMILLRAAPIGLLQGQPQIIVAFLTVLGIERAQNGSPVQGGVAMGLAIALKLTPLPIALLWFAARQQRAGLTALGVASALGGLSVAIAGWPIHEVFLAGLRSIDGTLLLNSQAYSLDFIVGVQLPDAYLRIQPAMAQLLPAMAPEKPVSWVVVAKPESYALFSRSVQIALLLTSGILLRRAHDPQVRAALWAAALTAFAFLGPIGWSYYYIAPLAFAPILVHRLGWAGGALLTMSGALCALHLPLAERFNGYAAQAGILIFLTGCLLAATFAKARSGGFQPLRTPRS